MLKKFCLLVTAIICMLWMGCQDDKTADLVIKNANIYAVDSNYVGDAIGIKEGLIMRIVHGQKLFL